MTGTTGNDELFATPSAGSSLLDGVFDTTFTGAGNDTIDLTLNPNARNNRVDGGSGLDTIFVTRNDRAFGGAGDDVFEATDGKGNNRMSGGAGDDTFYLGRDDRALGGDGNDRFFAGTGGENLLSGGAGVDQFWIVNGDIPTAANTILDFQIGTDVIGISGIGATAATLVLTQVGADTSIGFGGQSLAVLKGVQASSLTPSNASQFLFT